MSPDISVALHTFEFDGRDMQCSQTPLLSTCARTHHDLKVMNEQASTHLGALPLVLLFLNDVPLRTC
jgi:hypothetical protein